ncbi:hypothetical protein HHK36_023310 [Tetracentron sinense]|uniref:Uncharacterized protein n=1 Tax=Tetracentron sinense TaxID=13715 RepID=A0A834YMY3_TETSI|nr:hypothetical protein HHK36_023310 [Tetracentron sinense]
MIKGSAKSSPELLPVATNLEHPDDSTLEGLSANVKLLLKLIQDHKEACTKDKDDRKMQRVAGMITILDDVKGRIEKSQSSGKKKPELRRCYTELRPNNVPSENKGNEPVIDEKQRLRNELNASLAERKSLERMFSSLGKEKEIMATELARKVHELNSMEEHINDLKAQNEMLLVKVQACANEHKGNKCSDRETQGKMALQERIKALSEKLLKSLDGYRSLKRKFKEAQEENTGIHAMMKEMGVKVAAGFDRIRDFHRGITISNDQPVVIEEELSALEDMFQSFKMKVSKTEQDISEFVKQKADIKARKPPVLA